jgi:hypothetical protein
MAVTISDVHMRPRLSFTVVACMRDFHLLLVLIVLASACAVETNTTKRSKTRIVAHYHIGKAGGSSVMEYFHQIGAVTFHYGELNCFMCMPQHRDIFDGQQCEPMCRSKHSRLKADSLVFIEFHSWSRKFFWAEMVPHLAELRERHELVLTSVIVREPIDHILSFFAMFNPKSTASASTSIPLEDYLRSEASHGIQIRELTEDSGHSQPMELHSCNTSLAVERLRSFDIACTMRWLSRCSRLICEAVHHHRGMQSCVTRGMGGIGHVRPRSAGHHRAAPELLKASGNGSLPYALIRRAAACDQRLLDREQEWVHHIVRATPTANWRQSRSHSPTKTARTKQTRRFFLGEA